MSDKNVPEIVKMFPKFFDEIFATEIEYERSLSIKKLITVGKENGVKILPLKYPATYIKSFINQKSNSGKALVVLGSIYVLGKIKSGL
jgi:folylpolyglutamate synthase/dihydropteroate synthase